MVLTAQVLYGCYSAQVFRPSSSAGDANQIPSLNSRTTCVKLPSHAQMLISEGVGLSLIRVIRFI